MLVKYVVPSNTGHTVSADPVVLDVELGLVAGVARLELRHVLSGRLRGADVPMLVATSESPPALV